MICYLSLTQLTVHSDIEKLSGAEIDISRGDREKVPEADDGVHVNESENNEKVTIYLTSLIQTCFTFVLNLYYYLLFLLSLSKAELF